MGKWIDIYCKDNCKKLNSLVDYIIQMQFGWMPQCNYADIYSIAGQVVWNCEKNFDETKGVKFETLLMSCLLRKIKTYITYTNRKIRRPQDINGNPLSEVSIESLTSQDCDSKLIDSLIGDEDIRSELLTDKQEFCNGVQRYLDSLTSQQKEIALLISDGYEPNEIQKILHIDAEKYRMQWNKMTSLRKLSILCKERK